LFPIASAASTRAAVAFKGTSSTSTGSAEVVNGFNGNGLSLPLGRAQGVLNPLNMVQRNAEMALVAGNVHAQNIVLA
jgi:hypothetical protein